MMDEYETEYGDALMTAQQYEYVAQEICRILEVDRRDRGLYRRAVHNLGEEWMLETLGFCMVYIKPDCQRHTFEDRIREALSDGDIIVDTHED